MKLKENKFSDQVKSVFLSFVIPALVNVAGMIAWEKDIIPKKDNYFVLYCAVINALCGVLFLLTYRYIIPHLKILRAYGKYEGRWLQIIPDMPERPYEVIDFVFDHKEYKYEMYGINFETNLEDGVDFQAYRFVERAFNNGFYYITDTTAENKNGLGKVSFIKSNYDNLTRAEGYFFDSSNERCSRKYNTILIKCNKKLFQHLGVEYSYLKLNKIPPKALMELCKDFSDRQIDIYNSKQSTNCILSKKMPCKCVKERK